MVFFIMVIICNSRKIFYFRFYFIENCINSNNKNIRAEVFLLVFLFVKPFLNFFQAFLEISAFLEKLFADLSFWAFGLGFSILVSFMVMLWVYTLATVT